MALLTCRYQKTALRNVLKLYSQKCLQCQFEFTNYKQCSTLADSPNYHHTPSLVESQNKQLLSKLNDDLIIIKDFISPEEEKNIMDEINPYMARLRYEYDHWDNAIHGYRETERQQWSPSNQLVLDRIKNFAFPKGNPMALVHILDLEETGFIRPHVDSTRFCGDTIAGISLLSDSVMRLVSVEQKELSIDILLKRLSLYIMRNKARYDFSHEILNNDTSFFKGERIKKARRVSVICRNEPANSSSV